MGSNPAGHTFVATRLLNVPRPAPVERGVQRRAKEAFNVMTAAGPFCCSDDLAYAPLVALLEEAKTRKVSLTPTLTLTLTPTLTLTLTRPRCSCCTAPSSTSSTRRRARPR